MLSYRNSSHRSAGCSALTKPQSVSGLLEKCRGYAIWGWGQNVLWDHSRQIQYEGKQICDGKKIELCCRTEEGAECCFYSSLLTDIRGSLPTRLVPLANSKGISNLAHGGADVYWISLFRGNWIKDAATAIPDFDQRREPRYWKLEYTKHFPADPLVTPRLLPHFTLFFLFTFWPFVPAWLCLLLKGAYRILKK